MKLFLRPLDAKRPALSDLEIELYPLEGEREEERRASGEQLYAPALARPLSDVSYAAALLLEPGEQPPDAANLAFDDGEIALPAVRLGAPLPEEAGRISFRDICGGVQLRVDCTWKERPAAHYTTGRVSVKVRDGKMCRAMRRMIDYVRAHNRYLREIHLGGDAEMLDRLIGILDAIQNVYESNRPFFKMNSHTKMQEAYQVDDFLKLQGVTPQVLQYIARHPNELVPAEGRAGLRFGGRSYIPAHTLIEEKNRVRETGENRVVLGFIHNVALEARNRLKSLDDFLLACVEEEDGEGYIDSGGFILSAIGSQLRPLRARLAEVSDQLMETYWVYKEILPVEDLPLRRLPPPTPIFRNVVAYRQIYDAMRLWFDEGVCNISNENFLLFLNVNNRIYEYYALFRLAEAIEAEGYAYRPERSFRKLYAVKDFRKFRETEHENTFVFSKPGRGAITLYYQPVVRMNCAEALRNRIALRVCTRLKADYSGVRVENGGGWDWRNESQFYESRLSPDGVFFNPDYILKFSSGARERYIIADAKFCTLRIMRQLNFERLLFKYYFSIRPASRWASIEGIWALYGKGDGSRGEEQGRVTRSVFGWTPDGVRPDFWMSLLTEDGSEDSRRRQSRALARILRQLRTGRRAFAGAVSLPRRWRCAGPLGGDGARTTAFAGRSARV